MFLFVYLPAVCVLGDVMPISNIVLSQIQRHRKVQTGSQNEADKMIVVAVLDAQCK